MGAEMSPYFYAIIIDTIIIRKDGFNGRYV